MQFSLLIFLACWPDCRSQASSKKPSLAAGINDQHGHVNVPVLDMHACPPPDTSLETCLWILIPGWKWKFLLASLLQHNCCLLQAVSVAGGVGYCQFNPTDGHALPVKSSCYIPEQAVVETHELHEAMGCPDEADKVQLP
jgi:hypothetical protein